MKPIYLHCGLCGRKVDVRNGGILHKNVGPRNLWLCDDCANSGWNNNKVGTKLGNTQPNKLTGFSKTPAERIEYVKKISYLGD